MNLRVASHRLVRSPGARFDLLRLFGFVVLSVLAWAAEAANTFPNASPLATARTTPTATLKGYY